MGEANLVHTLLLPTLATTTLTEIFQRFHLTHIRKEWMVCWSYQRGLGESRSTNQVGQPIVDVNHLGVNRRHGVKRNWVPGAL